MGVVVNPYNIIQFMTIMILRDLTIVTCFNKIENMRLNNNKRTGMTSTITQLVCSK